MNKKDKLIFISMLLVASGIFGWIYEVIFYFINGGCKEIYLRGICFNPWIDIYALGAIFIYLLNKKNTDKPLLVFLKSGIICGILEYLAGVGIYTIFDGKRSWNYNTEILNFGNINGFICLRSVLFFALSGMILMYVMIPIIKKILNSKYKNIIGYIFIILFAIVLIDEIYNMLIMFKILDLPSAGKIYTDLGFHYWKS